VFSLTQLVLWKESFGSKCLLSGDSGGSDYVTEPNLRYFIKLSPHSSWLSSVQTHPRNYIFLTQVRSHYNQQKTREGNVVADSLAKDSLKRSDDLVA
jgi:hypothetical protein